MSSNGGDILSEERHQTVEAIERLASSEKTLHYALTVQILVCIVGIGVVFSVLPKLSITPSDVLEKVNVVEDKVDRISERDSALKMLSESITERQYAERTDN